MTRRRPLPPAFAEGAFRVSDALAAGLSPSRLRAADLISPARGIRVTLENLGDPMAAPLAHPGVGAAYPQARSDARRDIRAEVIQRARLLAPGLLHDEFVSHETALALLGAPLPRWPYEPRFHASAHRPTGVPRRAGVVGHRLQTRMSAASRVLGVECEDPARAWRQTGRLWGVDDLVAAGDYLVCARSRLITLDDLRHEVRTMGDVRGGKLAAALDLIREGVESPEETHLRLALHRAGLPEPEVNWTLRTAAGRHVARLDLAYRRYRVAVEYDGRVHAESVRQFRDDADRWDAIRAQGWQHVRVLNHHMRPDARVAVRKVADALVAAGWRPGGREMVQE